MKALLFPIIMAVSAAGGVMSADFAKNSLGASSAGNSEVGHGKADATSDNAHGSDKDHAKDKPGGHGGDGYAKSSEEKEFLNFKRQFVVPVLRDDSVSALILLNIAIETPAGKRDDMYRLEPRFRDAFIRELLQLSDSGYFDAELTSPETYEVIRETLYRAASDISNEGVGDVLILDLTRQDR